MPNKSFDYTYSRPWSRQQSPDIGPSATGISSVSRTSYVNFGPNIPNWKNLIKTGNDATTGMEGVRYGLPLWRPVSHYVSYPLVPGGFTRCEGYPMAPTFATPFALPTNKALALAETSFAKDYHNKTRRWTGGVFLGELRETARLLRNPVKGMYGLTRDFASTVRRLKALEIRRYTTALSDAWLVYQFGMKPLASDANDAGEALRALASGRTFDIVKIRGTGQDVTTGPTQTTSVGFVGAPGCESTTVTVTDSAVTIRGAWRNSTPGGELPVPMQFGLSVLDVIPTAWELIPWSFLVDYFTNVGDVLDAYTLRFVDFAWLNQTVRNNRSIIRTDWRAIPSVDPSTVQGGAMRSSSRSVSRAKRQNDFGGGFYIEAPGFESMKWLNIAALVNSIALSKR